MNKHLRNGDPLPGYLESSVGVLVSALMKLPPHEGVCYRGASIFDSALDAFYQRLSDKTAHLERSFLSASLSYDIAINHMDNILFEITSRTGRDITALSSYPDEREILFIADTYFYISMIKDYGHQSVYVIMSEV